MEKVTIILGNLIGEQKLIAVKIKKKSFQNKIIIKKIKNIAINCGLNQVFEVPIRCPITCLNPNGNYNCGPLDNTEDCYCADGFVLINGECSLPSNCGCKVADLGLILSVKNNYLNF